MSDKVIHLPQRRPKARNLPEPDPLETKGDECAVFVLRADGGSLWLSDEVLSREQLGGVLDFLDRVRAKIEDLHGVAT